MKSFLLLWSSCLKGVLFIKHSYQCFMATRGPVEHNNTQRRRRNRIPFFLPSSSSLFYWFLLLPFSLPIFAFLAKKMLTSAFLWLAIKKVRFILRDSQVKVQTNSGDDEKCIKTKIGNFFKNKIRWVRRILHASKL